jgi:hypothetical protein
VRNGSFKGIMGMQLDKGDLLDSQDYDSVDESVNGNASKPLDKSRDMT